MIKELHVELFRFDCKVDYLPYYKKYIVEYNQNDTVLSLLNKINSIEKFDYDNTNNLNLNLKINNLYLNSSALIADVVSATSSTDFIIEPVSKFRTLVDLKIDNSDFLEKINLFTKYVSEHDIQQYAVDLELDYYASNTYEIKKDYIGDHSLLIASDIIEQNSEFKDEILKIISKNDDGIFYHTSIKNRVLNYDLSKEAKIESLFSMLSDSMHKVNSDESFGEGKLNIVQGFDGFNIASFEGVNKTSSESMIEGSNAKYVDISLKNEDLALNSSLVNKDFSLKIAGNILLQAKDENADFIIVRNVHDIKLFDGEQKRIEKVVGREINLPVVSQEQFSKLLEGEKNISALGLDTHKVKVSFL
ncbi:DUF5644 domain-containing protein [Sulfurimonas sp.]|nr:DUF5644 domain-containing protein [Sulfurimonas sp.]